MNSSTRAADCHTATGLASNVTSRVGTIRSGTPRALEEKPEEIYVPLYDVAWPNALRWRGSVLIKVLPKMLFFALYSALFTVLHMLLKPRATFDIAASLISILGLVTGLLLVFRTNTAYDRYWEGRKLWSAMVVSVRNLSRQIWVGCKGRADKDLLEKRTAIRLLAGFAIAVKHYLRQEYGPNYADLAPYISHLPKYNFPSSVDTYVEGDGVEAQAKHNKHSMDINRAIRSNLPLEITLHLGSYLQYIRDQGRIEPPMLNAMTVGINQLTDALTGFERILRTPIPLAYSIHLSQTVWIFLLWLPFQLVKPLEWVTIPVVVLAAFTYFGIESIGGEIENPFGYDVNDLPLDDFVRVICKELQVVTESVPPNVDQWVLAAEQAEQERIRKHSLTSSEIEASAEISVDNY